MAIATQDYSEQIKTLSQEGLTTCQIEMRLASENGGSSPVSRTTIWRIVTGKTRSLITQA